MKRNVLLFIIGIVLFPATVVLASENLYDDYITNSNGVKLTKKEYDFVRNFYGNDFFDSMTMEEYNWLDDLDIQNRKVDISSSYTYDFPQFLPFGTSHSTSSKKISIAKSCISNMCSVYINAQWLTNPSIRSYDVIGARYDGTSLFNSEITTKVYSTAGTEYFSNTKKYSNGHGTSVKLPTDAKNIIIEQKFFVKPNGHVYASYQHAVKNISLETSLSYVIDINGYGDVFSFYGTAKDAFDQMNGVDISV